VWELAPFPDRLLEELRGDAAAKAEKPPRAGKPPRGSGRYAAAALRYEARLVREAAPGSRNRTLNRAAFNLGQLVAAGLLAREAVETVLAEVAQVAGLPEREVEATLRSGLTAGMRRPRAATS
jgi:hypothetical protein